LRDFQTIVALGESASCIKELYKYRGDEFINYLRNDYFVKVGFSFIFFLWGEGRGGGKNVIIIFTISVGMF